MILRRCIECNTLLLFKLQYVVEGNKYCERCFTNRIRNQKKEEEKRKVEENKRKEVESKKRKFEKDLKAKEELEKYKSKNSQKETLNTRHKKRKEEKPRQVEKKKKVRKKIIISQDEIRSYASILLIDASVKRLKVTEWRNGKEKRLLNKEREIRKTHAGGFSQEKFQKFVKFKKGKTFEWIMEKLEKEGVLRPPYELIKVECDEVLLRDKLLEYVKKFKE